MDTINNLNSTTTNLSSSNSSTSLDDGIFPFLTDNVEMYEGGLSASIPRLYFRWLTIGVCIIGILGKIYDI
jgi:hypothetical protein